VLEVNHGAAFRLPSRAGALILKPLAAQEQRLQRLRGLPREQVCARVPADRLRGTVPEQDLALAANQRKTFRKTIQRDFKKFRAIGHPYLSTSYIGTAHTFFTALWNGGKIDFRSGRENSGGALTMVEKNPYRHPYPFHVPHQ
jgi:hypothetical protein